MVDLANNSFANAYVLPTNPAAAVTPPFTNIGYTRETGEQGNAGATAWLVWYPDPTIVGSSVTVDNVGSNYDCYLGIYAATLVDTATWASNYTVSSITLIGQDDDSAGAAQSRVTFTVQANTMYFFQQGGYSSNQSANNVVRYPATLVVEPAVVGGGAGAGGGGGGGSGVGNMLGGFFLGETMLGADQAAGDSGTGTGVGNMLGGFFLGETMLGGDQAAGGGSSTAPPIGSVFSLTTAPAGAATATGTFTVVTIVLAGSPAGSATVVDYLNAPWSLAGRTDAAVAGTTKYAGPGTQSITTNVAQGTKSQTVNYTVNTGGGGAFVDVYRTSLSTGVESLYTTTTGAATFSSSFDVQAGFYVSRLTLRDSGGPVIAVWSYWANTDSKASSTIFIPFNLFAASAGTAAVTANLTNQIYSPVALDASTSGSATATGSLTQSVLRGSSSGNATASGSMGVAGRLVPEVSSASATVVGNPDNAKILAGNSAGSSAAVVADLVFVYYSRGQASVTGDLGRHLTPTAIIGTATVTADPKRLDAYQGDSKGVGTVVGQSRTSMFLSAPLIACGASGVANLTFPRALTGGSIVGTSTTTGTLLVYLLNGEVSTGSATASGTIRYADGIQHFTASIAGAATVDVDFRLRFKFGSQQINGTSSVVCDRLLRVWFVAGTPAGVSTVTFNTVDIYTIPPGPCAGSSTVVAYALLDGHYAGDIVGTALVKPTFPYVQTTFSGGTPQGIASLAARLYLKPKDFEPDTSSGFAAVLGQVLLAQAAVRGLSQGGRIELLDVYGRPFQIPAYNDTLVQGSLGQKFTFAGISRAEGFAKFDFAILLLNDSGLITGGSRLEVFLDILSKQYYSTSRGTSTARGRFDFARDLSAICSDAYSGVGRWYPDGFVHEYHYDYSLTMAPIPDLPEHAGLPGNALQHGANFNGDVFGVAYDYNAIRDSYRFGHVWDGTYAEWTDQDVPGLDLRQFPELWDPSKGVDSNGVGFTYDKFPGPMRRKYQLLSPGVFGAWAVDNRGPGYLDKAMRASSVGEARFNEPQSTVDMDLELKSSMRGKPIGRASVTAMALLLSFRKYLVEGNVTALREFAKTYAGNVAKSSEALLPIRRQDLNELEAVNHSTALYV